MSMLRRSIFELSRRGCIQRNPRQIPAYLSSRKEFSSASHQNASQGSGSKGNPLESDDELSKLDVASVIVGVSILTANQLGYFDELLGKEENILLRMGINNYKDLNNARYLGEPAAPVSKMNDAYTSEDGKLVLDLFQAIHVAEKRQAELDALVFGEEKKMLKEKYEKELKDPRERQLMYAEVAAILDKSRQELNKEIAKAAAAMKLLQEKAEDKLNMERKENEAELELQNIQELAKAELAAAIASEKTSQIESTSHRDERHVKSSSCRNK